MGFAADLRGTQALEGLRGRQLLRRACRPPAAHAGGCHAQRAVHQRGPGVKLQRRGHARKIAPAQITAQQAQRQRGQTRAQGNAQRAAGQPQQHGFSQHQAQPLPAGQAQHPQQRQLLRALGHTERQH